MSETRAPKSFAVYRCDACRRDTSEPFAMTEAELRPALDAGEVRAMRLHDGCAYGLGVERVVRTGETIFSVLGRLALRPSPNAAKREGNRARGRDRGGCSGPSWGRSGLTGA